MEKMLSVWATAITVENRLPRGLAWRRYLTETLVHEHRPTYSDGLCGTACQSACQKQPEVRW